jgi:hypothetical protein
MEMHLLNADHSKHQLYLTHVLQHHVEPTVNVVRSMDKLYVRVFKVLLVVHLLVDLNVFRIQNVIKMKHAVIKNAVIHVQELVE